jgi:hypothetical protein
VEQRERDAEIAMLTHVPKGTPNGDVPGFLLACRQIGAAIRQGTNAPVPGVAPACLGCGSPTKHYGDFVNHEYECGTCGEFTLRIKPLAVAGADA